MASRYQHIVKIPAAGNANIIELLGLLMYGWICYSRFVVGLVAIILLWVGLGVDRYWPWLVWYIDALNECLFLAFIRASRL